MSVSAPSRPSEGARASKGELRYQRRCIDKLGFAFRGDERLLDAGCGDGSVSHLLRPRVAEVVGIDVEPFAAWRDEGGVSFRRASAEKLPFADGEFDLVHSRDSLHHMDAPERALAEYRRVLRPGGAALIVEANRYNPLFYVHMTKLLGHEHFTQRRFRSLVGRVFPLSSFGTFEAHYAPGLDRLETVQQAVEELLERLPPLQTLLAYNFAVARI